MAASETYNVDCLEYMKGLPDNYFDLVVTDPPYGDGMRCEAEGSQYVQVERERERESCETEPPRSGEEHETAGRNVGLRGMEKRYNRFGGRFDRYRQTDSQTDRRRQASCKNRRNVV